VRAKQHTQTLAGFRISHEGFHVNVSGANTTAAHILGSIDYTDYSVSLVLFHLLTIHSPSQFLPLLLGRVQKRWKLVNRERHGEST